MVTFEDAKTVATEIVNLVNPLSIVVFGSVAREGRGQDLDLFIVVDDGVSSKATVAILQKKLKQYYQKFAIDEFVVNQSVLQEYYNKGSYFVKLIIKEGRSLYMKEAIVQWMKQAEEELNVSLYLLQGKFYKGSCYHAQQAIEKAIKALLLNKGWDLEKIHNVNRLMALCNDYTIHISLSDDDIVFIDSIYKGRYPADIGLLPLGEPDEHDAARATTIATQIVNEMNEYIKQK